MHVCLYNEYSNAVGSIICTNSKHIDKITLYIHVELTAISSRSALLWAIASAKFVAGGMSQCGFFLALSISEWFILTFRVINSVQFKP